MQHAIIKNGSVQNIVEWDGVSEFQVDGELVAIDENAYIGGEYDGAFVPRPPEPDNRTYVDKRRDEYPHLDDLIVALWEGVVEERMEAVVDLEGKRQAVKQKYPKP
jgi:hypothetical protein